MIDSKSSDENRQRRKPSATRANALDALQFSLDTFQLNGKFLAFLQTLYHRVENCGWLVRRTGRVGSALPPMYSESHEINRKLPKVQQQESEEVNRRTSDWSFKSCASYRHDCTPNRYFSISVSRIVDGYLRVENRGWLVRRTERVGSALPPTVLWVSGTWLITEDFRRFNSKRLN